MKKKLAAWIVLGLIAVVAAVCLGTTNEVTKDVIAEQNKVAAEAAWRELVPGAEFPDAEQAENEKEYVYAGMIDGEAAGYVAQVAVSGYGGEVEVIVGTDKEGTLTGIKVGGANFQETAGLGAKAKEPAFTDQFAGKVAPLSIGEEIDAITAATITSSAVVRGVNTAVERIAEVAGFEIKNTAEGGALSDGRYTATTKGFGGPVYVEIQLDEAGVITDIIIGNDEFNETAGYGQKAKDPAWYEQFIGKSGQITLGEDIDAISGATITSKAVVDAVNTALLYASDPEAAAAAAMGAEETPFEMPEIPADALTETASKPGFGGPVQATVTVDSAGEKLLMVEFGGDKWAETEGIGSKVLEPDFWQQLIGKSLPIDIEEVDLVSGATITSTAAVEAVNKAYDKMFPAEEATDAPVAQEAQSPNKAEASSKGYAGPVAAAITVDDAGAITEITFGSEKFAETAGLGAKALEPEFAAQFVGKMPPIAEADIDVISGATITTKAAIAAVNKAFEKLAPAGETPAEAQATETPAEAQPAQDGDKPANSASASKRGYEGPVYVEITVDGAGAIATLTVGNDRFAETTGLGAKALEPEFAAQFVGKTPPLAIEDIDAISGATITTEAVIAAINEAYAKLAPAEETPAEAQATETPAEAQPAPDGDKPANSANASKRGYEGPVYVEITVNDAGAIATLTVGNDRFAETAGLGAKAKEEAFTQQFVGKTPPLAIGDIDAISGATITTEAVIAAINEAYAKLAPAGEAPAETQTTETPTDAQPAPGGEKPASSANASKRGAQGPVYVEITVDGAGAIATLTIGNERFAETAGLGAKAKEEAFTQQFVGKTPPLAIEDIDAISGATITTEAVIAAINEAYAKLAPAGETPAETQAAKTPAEAQNAPDGDKPANWANASKRGYEGPVYVEITVDDAGAIATLTVGNDRFAETAGLGAKAKEEAFTQQFVGKTPPLAIGDIDAISGATITTEAVIAAINEAYQKLLAQQ